MIPYDLDPSLHAHAPEAEMLDDGFSPPHHDIDADEAKRQYVRATDNDDEDIGLGPKSLF